jgi:hypothetical protein
MKQFIAVVDWDGATGRVGKFQDFDTEEEASAHVERARENNKWPLAFVAESPGGGWAGLKVISVGELASEAPPVVEQPPTVEDRLAALEARLDAVEQKK